MASARNLHNFTQIQIDKQAPEFCSEMLHQRSSTDVGQCCPWPSCSPKGTFCEDSYLKIQGDIKIAQEHIIFF